jgi:hypothetical protein
MVLGLCVATSVLHGVHGRGRDGMGGSGLRYAYSDTQREDTDATVERNLLPLQDVKAGCGTGVGCETLPLRSSN